MQTGSEGISETREALFDLKPLAALLDEIQIDPQKIEDIKTEKRKIIDRIKKLLSGPYHFEPFGFSMPDGSRWLAQNPGLEGFWYTLCEVESVAGKWNIIPQMQYFFGYLYALFCESDFRDHAKALEAVKYDQTVNDEVRYSRLKEFLKKVLDDGRSTLESEDLSQWLRHGCIYQILLRAFNIAERRAILGQDPESVTGKFYVDIRPSDLPGPVETIRFTGTYPIGLFNAKGNGGGSPFSIKSFTNIDSQHGSAEETRDKIKSLEEQEVHSLFELLLNHTAVDSELVEFDPTLYIHVKEQPWDTRGYYDFTQAKTGERYWIRRGGYSYDGLRFYWDDTLQLDISNPITRQVLIDSIKDLIRLYGVYGFRVDMAYQLLHEPFRYNWGGEVAYPLSDKFEEEFLVQLIRGVKTEYPKAAFIAEGFNKWDKLSAAGFDLMYGQNDMILPGGFRHVGWYEALMKRESYNLTEAIKRAAFLYWQKGGAAEFCFVGHHDLPAPQRVFGDWLFGATFLTLMLPMAHNWYAGTEVDFEDPCSENGKMITFNKRTVIRWRGLDFHYSRFVSKCLNTIAEIKRDFGPIEMQPLWPQDGSQWIGYLLRPRGEAPSGRKALVLVNPAGYPLDVHISRPDLGVEHLSTRLDKAGPWGQELIWIDASGNVKHLVLGN